MNTTCNSPKFMRTKPLGSYRPHFLLVYISKFFRLFKNPFLVVCLNLALDTADLFF